jgi:hypothetical protein
LEVGPSVLLVAALIAQRGPSTVGYAGGSVDRRTDVACDANKLPRKQQEVLIDIGEKGDDANWNLVSLTMLERRRIATAQRTAVRP